MAEVAETESFDQHDEDCIKKQYRFCGPALNEHL
jgi:hypothetical protein